MMVSLPSLLLSLPIKFSPLVSHSPILNSKCRNSHPQSILTRNNTHSGGGDSGYSEESFATTTVSSSKRPLHTSCPHCHCEQRSSFNQYEKSVEHYLSDSSSTSDTTINKDIQATDFFSTQYQQSLSASRSYPHIKPLPKTKPIIQRRKSLTNKRRRRRHLSCDSSLWNRTQPPPSTHLVRISHANSSCLIFIGFRSLLLDVLDRIKSLFNVILPRLE